MAAVAGGLASVAPSSFPADLSPVGTMIGDAPIVALSEASHGVPEPLEFRNRLFEYLVENKGFTAIALESGIVESRVVHDYVLGDSSASEDTALAEGISWTFDRLPQNRALVRWMRDYNRHSRNGRQIHFYGFDVPGSPGEPNANRGMATALLEAMRYLFRVDSHAAQALQHRLEPLIENLRFDFQRTGDSPGYDRLSRVERDGLTALIADLNALMRQNKNKYAAATSTNDYEWAHRAAIGAEQADSWLREIPLDWVPSRDPLVLPSAQTRFFPTATDLRDRAQAENLEWIIGREGPSGKVLVFGHRYHLSAATVKVAWAGWREQVPMGTYLRERFGKRFVTIGNLTAREARELGQSSFLLDLLPGV